MLSILSSKITNWLAQEVNNSLARQTLVKMALRIAVVVLASTTISYLHVFALLEVQTKEQLEKYISERGQREKNLFALAEDNLAELKQELLWQLKQAGTQDPRTEFNQLFVKQTDGVTRNRPERFNYKRQAGLFVDPRIKINADVRRRVMIFYKMANAYGPAWKNRFASTYFLAPENFSVSYWPTVPIAQQQAADFYEPGQEYFYISDRQHNPQRKTAWTGVYFDSLVKNWMVSCVSPVYVGDRHIATVGHDVLLDELIKRTVNNQLKGTYNIIFRKDGRLIAHPQLMKEIEASGGKFDILKSGDEHLKQIFQQAKTINSKEAVIDNAKNNEYLAVTTIPEPDWYFVTVFPKSLLSKEAQATAWFILILGFVALLVEVWALFSVLRKQVATPLNQFTQATDQIASGNLNIKIDATRKDELGRLASSFNLMASAIRERDAQLANQNTQLEQQVDNRTRELTETINQLSAQILERQKAEEALRQSEELFRSLSSCSPVGIFLTDTNGHCTYTNPRYQEITNLTFEASLGEGWTQSIHPEDSERVCASWVAYTQQRQEYSEEYRLSLDGIIRWVYVCSAPIFSDMGDLLGYVGTLEDITQRKQAEDDIYKALLKEKELNELKSSFISMASHEFRTPLTVILSSSELLQVFGDKFSDDKKLQYFNKIQDQVKNMTQLLEDVLFLGKSDVAHLEFNPAAMDLEQWCRSLIEEMQVMKTEQHTIEFTYIHKPNNSPPSTIAYMDEKLLQHIFSNLLSNAIKYSPSGGVVQFKVTIEEKCAIFDITDSGIGIPPEDLQKLFNTFHRAKNVGNIPGTGLGLAIVQNSVKLHGGTINVKSEIGKGTTFTVNLPWNCESSVVN
ncbi:MAG TPA: ATP-binding protein [Oculatellaceae cyanobacterium]|jgi:PAS domain S-box-containing protein